MNNREAMQKAFKEKYAELGADTWNYIGYEKIFEFGWNACLASQAQQPTDLSKQLREYAADSGYSHNDYADTMLAAASEIERCAAILAASQAQQSQWISVEEAKATLKDGDLIYVAFPNRKVSEAVYKFEQGFYPHRIISDYGNERIEHCTHVMHRKPAPLPPAPEVDKP